MSRNASKRLIIILSVAAAALTLLSFLIGIVYQWFFVEKAKKPTWTSTATMYVTNSNDTKYIYSTSDTYSATDLIKTCAVVIGTNQVRMQIVDQLNATEQSKADASAENGETYEPYKYNSGNIGSINITSVNETEVMRISVTNTDPDRAVEVCNAILKVVPKVLKEKIMVGAANPIDDAQPAYIGNLPNFRSALSTGAACAGIVLAISVIPIVVIIIITKVKSKPNRMNEVKNSEQ